MLPTEPHLDPLSGAGQSTTDGHFAVYDPATGSKIAEVADASAAEARAAVDRASRAFPTYAAQSSRRRGQWLRDWGDALALARSELTELITREQGKPLAEAKAEVDYAVAYLHWFAEQATRIEGEVLPSPASGRRLFVLRQPVGVAALITPWNFPLAMVMRKAAPALAAGCSVLIKPSELTPLVAQRAIELGLSAGFPDGMLNLVTTRDPQAVVGAWLADERVRKLSFTGSTAVGRLLVAGSAAHLPRLSLELGGNAPFIVFADADLDAAVAGLISAKFRNAGQTCISANRVLLAHEIAEPFIDRLLPRIAELRVGSGMEPQTAIGPLIDARAVAKVERLRLEAVAAGAAELLSGGPRPDLGPHFVAPTVLDRVAPSMSVWREEQFGPLLAIRRFVDESEALNLANDADAGLAAYLYSRDAARQWRCAEALQVGMVGINTGAISSELMPFGGIKASGYGREGAQCGIDEYLERKALSLAL